MTSSAIVHCQTEAPSDWLISVLKFGSVSQAAASTMCADANDKYMITEEAVWSEYMTKTQAASSSSSSSSSATAVPLPSVAAAKP